MQIYVVVVDEATGQLVQQGLDELAILVSLLVHPLPRAFASHRTVHPACRVFPVPPRWCWLQPPPLLLRRCSCCRCLCCDAAGVQPHHPQHQQPGVTAGLQG